MNPLPFFVKGIQVLFTTKIPIFAFNNKMKRIAVIFFTLLYLISTSGVAYSSFYCCGKLKTTYFFKTQDLTKNCKGNKKLPGCCDTKTYFVKVKDNHSPSQQFKFPDNNFSKQLFTVAQIFAHSLYSVNEETSFTFSHAPPLISKQPVYLSVCNFRI